MAFRRCSESGQWSGKGQNETSPTGWTNYTPCFPVEVQKLFDKVYEHGGTVGAVEKLKIAQWTRYLEILGYTLSLFALILSMIIFRKFRALRNSRTRIHYSLFLSMTVGVLIRLILYFDQVLSRNNNGKYHGIENVPYLCEGFYVLLECSTSSMFMWMLIEGFYLHVLVSSNALRERNSHVAFTVAGWAVPMLNTAIWAVMTASYYQGGTANTCWYGYNFNGLYWLIQGPRLAVIMVNMLFLLNIMRVVINKLRLTQDTEMEKARKAVRAALVLLPLLGITNVLNMIEAPLDGSVWKFGTWCLTTHFFRSFQGFFISMLYCFFNAEVRFVLKKYFHTRTLKRNDVRRHRVIEARVTRLRRGEADDADGIPMRTFRCGAFGNTHDNTAARRLANHPATHRTSSRANLPTSSRANLPTSSRANLPTSSRANLPASSRANLPTSSRANLPANRPANRPVDLKVTFGTVFTDGHSAGTQIRKENERRRDIDSI